MKPVILLCAAWWFASGERTPQIVRISDDQVKVIGSTVELSCSVLYIQHYSVLWTKVDRDSKSRNERLIISDRSTPFLRDSRFSLRYDTSSTTYTLQIRDIQNSDAGVYRCEIWMSLNNYIVKEVQLIVQSAPIIYDNSSSTVVVSESNPVSLECYAGGQPKPLISWKRENDAILPTGGTVYRGNVLKINSVKKEDRGTYYCIADNKVGDTVKRSIAVEVEFPPTAKAGRQYVQQALNYDADLECRVEAFPMPTIVWIKDGVQVTNGQNFKIAPTTPIGQYQDSTLRVVTVEPRQYGVYLCRAVNKLGEGEADIHLEEADDPVCPPACGSGHFSGGTAFSPNSNLVWLLAGVSVFAFWPASSALPRW